MSDSDPVALERPLVWIGLALFGALALLGYVENGVIGAVNQVVIGASIYVVLYIAAGGW